MKHNGMRIAVLSGIGALCCSGSAFAGQDSTAAQDKTFLSKSAEGSMAEIQMGKLAAKKSKNEEVKDFGQKMVTDHGKLLSDMKPYCEKMSVKPPMKLNSEHQADYKRLSALSGDKFDKEYIKMMVEDHHKDLSEFKAEESSTSNSELKSTVAQGTQVIQQHSDMIDQIAQKNGISTSPTGRM